MIPVECQAWTREANRKAKKSPRSLAALMHLVAEAVRLGQALHMFPHLLPHICSTFHHLPTHFVGILSVRSSPRCGSASHARPALFFGESNGPAHSWVACPSQKGWTTHTAIHQPWATHLLEEKYIIVRLTLRPEALSTHTY